MTITPNQARELLHETTPAPWNPGHRTLSTGQWYDREILTVEPGVCEDVGEADQELIIAAPVMAKLISGMAYQYMIESNMDGEWDSWDGVMHDNPFDARIDLRVHREAMRDEGYQFRLVRYLVSCEPEVMEMPD